MEAAAKAGRLPQLAKYEVLEEIGHGGMATVYRAKDKRLGREVAVKVIHPHLRDSPEVAHRFAVEAKAVAKLRHANIVEVYDVSGEDEPEQYLVCELLRGITLRKLLQREKSLPPEVAAALAIELLHALAHAHAAGVIHRDIKPENVIIEQRPPISQAPSDGRPSPADQLGDRVVVKLTDFGIAKLLDAQGVTSTGQVLGSPAHMAPEQIEGGDVDARADVFGLGVLLYECMVGHLPFEGNNPAQVLRRVLEGTFPPPEGEKETIGRSFGAILEQALAHDPNDRYPDAIAMREAIQRELKRLGVAAPRAELEAWSDDPRGYEERHAKKMIDVLCVEAAAARKRGDAISAAGDYNRALAYAPHDPALLKIVASMHRAETRARFAKQAVRIGGATLVLGAVAFFVTGAIRPKKITSEPLSSSAASPIPTPDTSRTAPFDTAPTSSTAEAREARLDPPENPSASPTTSAAVPVTSHVLAKPTASVPPRETKRVITFGLQPPTGVLMTIDGDAESEVSSGSTYTAHDTKAHTFTFRCVQDLCVEPAVRAVPEGEDNRSVFAALKFKNATLIVDGDPTAQYTLIDRNISLHAGVATQVTMSRGRDIMTVVQVNGNKSRTVTLIAGQARHASFAE